MAYTDPSGHIACDELGTETCHLDESGKNTSQYVDPIPHSKWGEYDRFNDVLDFIHNEMIENAQSEPVQNIYGYNNYEPFFYQTSKGVQVAQIDEKQQKYHQPDESSIDKPQK